MGLALGEPVFAVETAIEAVSLDSLRESSYQLLMEAYAANENWAEAVTSIIDCTSPWPKSWEQGCPPRPRPCTWSS
jgi:hypothetical protein